MENVDRIAAAEKTAKWATGVLGEGDLETVDYLEAIAEVLLARLQLDLVRTRLEVAASEQQAFPAMLVERVAGAPTEVIEQHDVDQVPEQVPALQQPARRCRKYFDAGRMYPAVCDLPAGHEGAHAAQEEG